MILPSVMGRTREKIGLKLSSTPRPLRHHVKGATNPPRDYKNSRRGCPKRDALFKMNKTIRRLPYHHHLAGGVVSDLDEVGARCRHIKPYGRTTVYALLTSPRTLVRLAPPPWYADAPPARIHPRPPSVRSQCNSGTTFAIFP